MTPTKFSSLACVILAAGMGTRMKSALPKVLHEVAGRSMIRHVLTACEALGAEKIVTVLAPNSRAVEEAIQPHSFVTQSDPLGTGHAAKSAAAALKDFKGEILILVGDMPLLTPEALTLLRAKKAESGAALVVGGFLPPEAGQYGRLVVDSKGNLEAIVEVAEATEEQKAIRLCNSGIMLFESEVLWPLLDQLKNENAKGEYYLTDCIQLARMAGKTCSVATFPPELTDDVKGINTRAELAEAERLMQKRLRLKAMLAGVTMRDPKTVFLAMDTVLGRDVTLEPNVVFGKGVEVGEGVTIRAFSHLEQVKIAARAQIGPFARLRPGAVLGEEVHIGNFVEIKNATVEAGAKVNHLTYIGDATIGEKTNIGAGTITCNYDGFHKSRTIIGKGAFIGSNTALVAPVNVGDGALIAAGSVITLDVPSDALSVARSKQDTKEGWAKRFRDKQKKA